MAAVYAAKGLGICAGRAMVRKSASGETAVAAPLADRWRGPSTQPAFGPMNFGSHNVARHQFVPIGAESWIRLETIETRTIPAPSRQDFAAPS